MKRLLPWGLALLLSGCIPQEPRPVPPQPFQFRRLDLSQNDAGGRRLWELRSPRARYSLDQRQATVEQPSGRLFRQGQPAYAISAHQGVVIRDGEQVQLKGGVSLRTLDQRRLLIRADQAVWRPSAHTIDLIGSPVAEEGRQRLTAGSARFNTAEERLELSGAPRLRSWDQTPPGRGSPTLDVAVQNGVWNAGSGQLTAAGPVNGRQRRDQGGADRQLTAAALEGNTREEWLDLRAPVTMSDPAEQSILQAGRSRWWYRQKRITSDEPAQARVRQLAIAGADVEVRQNEQQIRIGRGCQLTQPNESLRADRCVWNWRSGALQADGSVELRRSSMRQVTRAGTLQGTTDARGQVTVAAPGQRVTTVLQVPPGRQRPQPPPPPSQPSPRAIAF